MTWNCGNSHYERAFVDAVDRFRVHHGRDANVILVAPDVWAALAESELLSRHRNVVLAMGFGTVSIERDPTLPLGVYHATRRDPPLHPDWHPSHREIL